MNGHRRGLGRRIGPIVVAIVALGASSARAASPPTDPAGFTSFVVQKFRDLRPTDGIKVTGDLQLDITAPAGEFTTDLHPLLSICTRAPDRCEEVVTDRVAKPLGVPRHTC